MKEYDIIVIGSGGGSKLVRPAAALGKKVAIIEEGPLGGTCLNRGCIPSKMLIHAADVATEIRSAPRFDFDPQPEPRVHFSELVQRVSQVIDADSESIAPLYNDNANIDYYPHRARFIDHKILQVAEHKLTAPQIFLPVGCRPHIPNIPGLENTPYMTSTEALRRTDLPKSMLVIGAGYIACELGYFYGALGCDVHFVVRSKLLRTADPDVQKEFARVFEKQFPIHYVRPQSVEYDRQFHLHCENGEVLSHESLLIATGVVPNSDTLNLAATGVDVDEEGWIVVDEKLQTSCEGVFAFGDVIGRHLFRHTANYEGEYLFRSQVEASAQGPIQYPPIPHAVFGHPQVAGVGANEQDLEPGSYVVGLNKYADSAMGMALRSESGFVKLLVGRAGKRLLGAHIVGEEASNMIHMLIAYMKMHATLDDILDTIYIHPALPELVRNAARKARQALEEGGQ